MGNTRFLVLHYCYGTNRLISGVSAAVLQLQQQQSTQTQLNLPKNSPLCASLAQEDL